MSESFRSAVAYRNDLCKTIADLQQRATRPLPDNATVFVGATSALYRLVKDLGATYDDLTSRIIVPSDGTSNRWVQESVFGSSPWSGIEVATAADGIAAAGASTWAPLGGDNSGSYQLSTGDTDMFEVNPTNSVMTYRGLPRFMLATSIVTVTTAEIDMISSVIAKNGDVAADATAQPLKGEQAATVSVTNGRVCITTQRGMFLAPGDTLRLMLRSVNGDQTMTMREFSLSVVPR